MASDSSSSTPIALTPESTGSLDLATSKKSRRQTAFYPNVNSSNKPQKPFSRSAAKRESVMALGSIEYLQHYFTKTGIAAKKNHLQNKQLNGLVPAIGGLTHVKTSPSVSSIPELPPSPVVPPAIRPAFPPYVKTYETNPDSLLPGVVEDLTAIIQAWGINRQLTSAHQTQHDPERLGVGGQDTVSKFDVLGTLKITTRAVRSIRNYVVSLPDESAGTLRGQFRPRTLSSIAASPKRNTSRSSSSDPLTLIRRSALEVLTVLRELEESSRLPLLDEAYDAQSDSGSQGNNNPHSRVASPSGFDDPDNHSHDARQQLQEVDPDTSVAFSLVQVRGRNDSVPVWEEEDDEDSLSEDDREKREHWDERLVLGSGWLYRQDIKLEDLAKEQAVIGRYLNVVDEALFGGPRDSRRGWERERERVARKDRGERDGRPKGRRASAGGTEGQAAHFSSSVGRRVVSTGVLDAMRNMALTEEPEEMDSVSEEGSVDDEELPAWAKRSLFVEDDYGRVHAMLVNLLPVDLLPALPPIENHKDFLHGLSSGQLICVAYNNAVRRSRKPWGYISNDAIHDIIALEQAHTAIGVDREKDESGKKGWTFRRTDNLRLWIAALKLRYLMPIIAPPVAQLTVNAPTGVTPPSPSAPRFHTTEPPFHFDARAVARQEEGWDSMLETALLRWMTTVVEERRGDR